MPAKSKKQRRFMGIVAAIQEGKMKHASKGAEKAAEGMSKEDVKDYASTKEKNLPLKKKLAQRKQGK
ncbi:MAG: DUF3008 domain-containing protein [Candidatus Omnitrophota bacterium]